MTHSASRDEAAARVAAVVVTSVLLVGAGLTELVALLVYGIRCDDGCATTPGPQGWKSDPDAWQWTFQLAWATTVLALAVAALALAIDGRLRAAAATAAFGVAAFLGWLWFVAC